MTLATHAVVGAAFAELFPSHPVAAFAAGFASHLAIDAIPHWDYTPKSIKKNESHPLETDMVLGRYFLQDCLKIAIDALLGLLLSVLIFYYFFPVFPGAPLSIVIIGVIAGILPDPLQFVYWKTRTSLLLPLQKFHVWVQEGKSLEVKPWVGISLQLILVLIICLLVYQIKR